MSVRELNINRLAQLGGLYGVMAIANARIKQIDDHGFNPQQDDGYERDELLRAAACYLLLQVPDTNGGEYVTPEVMTGLGLWPWHPEWFKPKDRLENLERAGALIAAELDRLHRADVESRQLPLWVGIDMAEPGSERTVIQYEDGSIEVFKAK
jgi:hypothetical protein